MGKTVLIDMDLIRGGVASYFDIRCRYTIADVMDAAEKLDKQLLDNALTIHKKSGVAILSRPDLPEDTQRVNQSGLVRLLNMLSRVFDLRGGRFADEHFTRCIPRCCRGRKRTCW